MNLRRLGMSLSLARYDRSRLQVAAAGMPPALIFRRSDGQVEECLISAPPLGTLEQRSFTERSLRLAPGDAALFATDGLVELLDPEDEVLGYPAVVTSWQTLLSASRYAAREVDPTRSTPRRRRVTRCSAS